MKLPRLEYDDLEYQQELIAFTGYNNTLKPRDSEYVGGKNLCSDDEPCLTQVRNPEEIELPDGKKNGIIEYNDKLCIFIGTSMYVIKDNVQVDKFEDMFYDNEKILTYFNDNIIILPDCLYYDGFVVGNIEVSYESEAAEIEFTANSIKSTTTTFNGFSVGDGVKISGSSVNSNNKVAIIREIMPDRKTIVFDDNIFTPVVEPLGIRVTREMPVMDFLVEYENRLWGCRGSTIYASKLGDFRNWNVFQGLATDSYAVDVGSPGDFTGIIKTHSMLTFSKIDCIHKLYGNKPSNFEITQAIPCNGVNFNCHKSIVTIEGVAYYVSKSSVMRYAGGLPEPVGYNLSRDFSKPNIQRGIGLEWGTRDRFETEIADVCYGKGMFVALAYDRDNIGKVIATSTDGINWEWQTTPIIPSSDWKNGEWIAIAYGGGMFVAIRRTYYYQDQSVKQLMYSTDGINWSFAPDPLPGNYFQDVCFGNGIFVVLCGVFQHGVKIMTSSNGISWTARYIPNSSWENSLDWSAVTFGNGKFVAVSAQDGHLFTIDQILVSSNGIDWEFVPVPRNGWTDVAFGNGRFVAVAEYGDETKEQPNGDGIMTSTDGINWTVVDTSKVYQSYRRVCFGGGMFVACPSGYLKSGGSTSVINPEYVLYSLDGLVWEKSNDPIVTVQALTYGNDKFLFFDNLRYYVLADVMTESKMEAAAGTDGRKYYLSIFLNGKWQYVAYDPWNNRWDYIDDLKINVFANNHVNGLVYGLDDENLRYAAQDNAIVWEVTTKALFNHNKKLYKKIGILTDVEVPGVIDIYIKRDNGLWSLFKSFNVGTGYQVLNATLKLKRNSYFQLKLQGNCRCKIYGIEYKWLEGSDV